jgi:VCBS repeat protein
MQRQFRLSSQKKSSAEFKTSRFKLQDDRWSSHDPHRRMATGRSNYLTKQTGEYLVAAELSRRGCIATTFTGNVPHYDIVAVDEHGGHALVQVKAIAGKSWQFGGAYGPILVPNWSLRGVADFNRDTHPDYALFNASNGQTAIWYLSGPTRIASAYGPTLPSGWELVATGDFNADGHPDYVLYNASTRQTAIWYLNNNVFVSSAFGPTIPAGWSLVGP